MSFDNSNQKAKSTYFSLPIKEKSERTVANRIYVDPFTRHKEMMKFYTAPKKQSQPMTTEVQILKKHHKFLRRDGPETWEERLAAKYYDLLFKEYCLGDFSRYQTGQIGLRWRTKEECISGKGQFICGNLKCSATDLKSIEVNFRYKEDGQIESALVKIRLCPKCTEKLYFYKNNSRKSKSEETQPKLKKPRITEEEEDQESVKSTSEVEEEQIEPKEEPDSHWSGQVKLETEKSKEEEMDDFLREMLL